METDTEQSEPIGRRPNSNGPGESGSKGDTASGSRRTPSTVRVAERARASGCRNLAEAAASASGPAKDLRRATGRSVANDPGSIEIDRATELSLASVGKRQAIRAIARTDATDATTE